MLAVNKGVVGGRLSYLVELAGLINPERISGAIGLLGNASE